VQNLPRKNQQFLEDIRLMKNSFPTVPSEFHFMSTLTEPGNVKGVPVDQDFTRVLLPTVRTRTNIFNQKLVAETDGLLI
jgi:hypothetical protein